MTEIFSASHVVLLLVKKYPQFNIINFDRLDCKYKFAFFKHSYNLLNIEY